MTCPGDPCCAAADCTAAPAMLLHPTTLQVLDQFPDSQISYGIDLSSARHAHDEQIPLLTACSVPMPNPAAAASACTVDDAATCTQRAPQHASCALTALSPPHEPDPCDTFIKPPSTFFASVVAPASLCCTPPSDHLLPFVTASLPAALPPSGASCSSCRSRSLSAELLVIEGSRCSC